MIRVKKINLSSGQKKIVSIVAIIVLPTVLVVGYYVGKKIYMKNKSKKLGVKKEETKLNIDSNEFKG